MKIKFIKKDGLNILENINILSAVLLIIFFALIKKSFISTFNINNMLTDISPLLIMGCGISFVIFIGSIDLSLGAICSCSAVIFALLIPQIGNWAYLVALVYGIIAGLLNGFIHVKFKIPSLILTLGTMGIWQSVAYVLSGGAPIQIKLSYWSNFAWVKIRFGVLTFPFILAFTFFIISCVMEKYTKIGIYSLAIGANERAARIAGLNIVWIKIFVFTFCGFCSGLTGIFLSCKLKSGIPTIGNPFTLIAIAAVVLGGNSLLGGRGSIFGALLGTAIITIIQNGMNLVGVDSFWQQIVFGIIIILVTCMTINRRGRDIVMK